MPTNVKIDRGVAFDGAAIPQGGIGNYMLLINKEDLDNGVITTDAVSHEIETITLDSGTYAYKIESSKGSAQIIPSSVLRAVSAIDGFDHSVDTIFLDVTQLSRENIARMRFQKVVAIVPLTNGKSIMYGRNVGMRISSFEEKPGDADTGGIIKAMLMTPANDPPEIDPPILIESTFDILTLLAS
jgi:hypothetical protein